jgi:hypothetical protein
VRGYGKKVTVTCLTGVRYAATFSGNDCTAEAGQFRKSDITTRTSAFPSRTGVVSPHAVRPKTANFSREPPFLLRGLSYKREWPTERADSPSELAAWMVAAVI